MRTLLFDKLTGEHIEDLDVTDVSWTQTIGSPDSVKFEVPAYTPAMRKLGLRNLVTPTKTVIAVEEPGWADFVGAGDVGLPEYDTDTQKLSLPASGVETILGKRVVLPANVGALIGSDGKPVATYDTNLKNWEYGTIIKKLIVQAMAQPGFNLPWVFEPDRIGTREKNTAAADMKNLLELVEDISNLDGGVETDFTSRWADDNHTRMQTLVRTGTDAVRVISSQSEFAFSLRGKKPTARSLKEQILPNYLTSRVWMTGGKDDDRMLVARANSSYLTDLGFPFMETVDSSHSSVSVLATLQSYANRRLSQGQKLGRFWKFDVRKSAAVGMRKGDRLNLLVKGDPFIPDDDYRHRVVSLSGGVSEWLSVVTAEEF